LQGEMCFANVLVFRTIPKRVVYLTSR